MEASDLFAQFQLLWRAGTNARLNLECHAGQAWMSLHVHLPCPPRQQQQQQHHRGRPGPSRLRRRARRAKAREKAAEKAVDISKDNPSADNSQPSSSNDHVAVQATTEETIVEKVPINAVIKTQICFSDAAAQVDLCVHHHHHQEYVQDALCPDKHFLSAAEAVSPLPQLDGAIDQEYEQVHAQEHHQEHASQLLSLSSQRGMMIFSRKESEDRLRQEREKDLQELQNLLN